MSDLHGHFQRLPLENRVFWIQTAGSHNRNGRNTEIAIKTWERAHGMTRERAVLEFMVWLTAARESIGMEGIGHA